ncbi:MAG: CoA-binding protein [Candidatus Zixiibacteriota bacterium]|nr:MAG: CoA-binding protein [candidate division Zixibacteria bacterium]
MNDSPQHTNPPDHEIRRILQTYKKVAVVGLSSNPSRTSHCVARYLQGQGFKIIPVNPKETEILGEKAYPDLNSIPEKFEIVDIFRRPEHVPAIVDQAIKAGAKVIWMQEGVVNRDAAIKASESGLTVVMDRCMWKECRILCE